MNAPDPHAPNATIVARRDLNDRVAILHVRPDGGEVAPFVPGQFIQLGLPADEVAPPPDAPTRTKLVKRSYSIASAPREHEAYEILIAFVDSGKLTPKLRGYGIGDRVWHDPVPKGHFTMERVARGQDLVFVATGTGVAPFVSMLRQHGSDTLRFAHLVVVHGAREQSDLAYHDELVGAAKRDRRVRYVPILSRESRSSDWSGLRGHVQTALEPACFQSRAGFALDKLSAQIFLCGNPAMIDDVRLRLAARGFITNTPKTPGNVHFERYW
ncbi:MAG: ferredoxin--NADP reductase [Planctomycetota bacterium]|nr:ferredoxin--NADP reductase [Planctomycetota bacterium]